MVTYKYVKLLYFELIYGGGNLDRFFVKKTKKKHSESYSNEMIAFYRSQERFFHRDSSIFMKFEAAACSGDIASFLKMPDFELLTVKVWNGGFRFIGKVRSSKIRKK